MIAFTKFNEDPNARFGTVMIDPQRVESCTVGEHKIAHGGIAHTLTIVMQSGLTHIVYGGMSDYLKIEKFLSVQDLGDVSGFEVSDFLAKKIAWHEQNPDKSLSDEYRKGFVSGLIHARQTVGDMQNAMGIESEL